MSMTITGVADTVDGIERFRNTLIRKLNRVMVTNSLRVQREAQKMVPVDFGFLKNSAFITVKNSVDTYTAKENDSPSAHQEAIDEVERYKDDIVTGVVSFAVYYALFVHEDLNASHKVGEAQFLMKALDKVKPTFQKEMEGVCQV